MYQHIPKNYELKIYVTVMVFLILGIQMMVPFVVNVPKVSKAMEDFANAMPVQRTPVTLGSAVMIQIRPPFTGVDPALRGTEGMVSIVFQLLVNKGHLHVSM